MASAQDCQGRVALITGASGGMGAAVAAAFASRGASLALFGRNMPTLQVLAEQLSQAYGVQTLPLVADVGEGGSLQRAVEQVIDVYGRIDFLLCFAGYNLDYPRISEATPSPDQLENLELIVNVDLLGSARMVFLVEPHMRRQREGAILLIGNSPTLNTEPHDLMYQVAKAGNKKLVEVLAAQHRRDGFPGLRAYFLAPHFIYNPSTFLGMTAEQRLRADEDGWLDSSLHVAPLVYALMTGALRRDSGSSILLNFQTASAYFAALEQPFPAFRPG